MIFTPEPYQQRAHDFFLSHERAYLLAGMGLGKTASTLSALHTLFLNGEIRSALIVAPLRVATLTWPNEIRKWDMSQNLWVESLRHQRPSGNSQLYLLNYESLHKLPNLDFADVVVFDETTKAKNPNSKRINGLRKLLGPQRRWGLTGTPRPNSLLELFAQVRLLDDGQRLGKSYAHFRDTYFTSDFMGYKWTPRPGAADAIYDRIADLSLTLLSSEYLNIPDTIVEDIEVALPDEARSTYDELEREMLVMCREGDIVAVNAAVLANKLLQVTGGFAYTEARGVVNIHSAKVAALKKLLTSLGENAIVVTNFIHEREAVVAALGDGAVDAAKFKGDLEDAWNSGRIKWLVADPRSLGHGLNLQKGGRTVVWYSPNYSRELYDQTNARVARKGQDQQPLVYRILCPGTIDDVVVETLRERGDEQSAMLNLLANYKRLLTPFHTFGNLAA